MGTASRCKSPSNESNGCAATTSLELPSLLTGSKRSKGPVVRSWRRWSGWPWMFMAVAAALLLTGAAPGSFPAAGPTDEPFAWAAWIYDAARSGEWRLALAAGLVVLCELVRRLTARFKPELEAQPWWREYGVAWLPIVLAVLGAVAVDLAAHKPTLASVWRAIGIGATAGQGYKLALKPLAKLALALVRRYLFPAPAATPPPAP